MSAQRIEQLAEGVTLAPGDCRIVLPQGFEANSFDACVTDPPYGLGFMGKGWDHGVPDVAHWRAIFRVLKPGAHLLSFGGTRTFGRLWVVIEEAGFEIRDTIMWVYGSGFPKSLDVSKAIDKAAGAEAVRTGVYKRASIQRNGDGETWKAGAFASHPEDSKCVEVTAPATAAARQWSGYGTALKPAVEPIILARKPLEGTVAANVLKWGTGALNIDGCRVGYESESDKRLETRGVHASATSYDGLGENGGAFGGLPVGRTIAAPHNNGRWPANLIHDGSEEVIAAFPETTSGSGDKHNKSEHGEIFRGIRPISGLRNYEGDSGSAARFFYSAKADQDDRLGSRHPTIKPVDVKQYLCRLVGRKGALILDPFAGTGTTGEAAFREGMRAVLIEREEEYCADIRRRMALVMSGPEERKREGLKARNADKPADHGPLFA